ncbi:excisionase family protein [Hahella ganghwensis]|uniref:excisionase family protein n=1 Tax=Hahella ganghwensis TaxID=286420 RepID=UPI00035F4360|nr:excisionase family protein [Hahella ganghwensis]
MASPESKNSLGVVPAKWVYVNLLWPLFGITRDAADAYRKKGAWLEGKHWKLRGRLAVYNWHEIEKWMGSEEVSAA